jgi:hypothetical protein
MARPGPISIAVAVATTKRCLSAPQYRISLHDLVLGETQTTIDTLRGIMKPAPEPIPDEAGFHARLREYDAAIEQLVSISCVLSYYGGGDSTLLIAECMRRLLNYREASSYEQWQRLRLYPALVTSYASGIAALAGGHFDNLRAVLVTPSYIDPFDRREPSYAAYAL